MAEAGIGSSPSFRGTIRSCASGEQGLHILEATLAVYLSAATGETVGLPLPPDHPVAREGVVGLTHMILPPWSPVSRRGMFGIRASEET
jgi:hypothetical protein